MRKKYKKASFFVLVFFLFSIGEIYLLTAPAELESATLTNAKGLITSSRLSFKMALNGNHDSGETYITVKASSDDDTDHLFPGDSVTIGSTTARTVTTIVDATHFTIDTGLSAGASDDDTVYVNQTAVHTISFNTASSVPDGLIRVLIPASTSDANNSDGVADGDGFDLDSIDTSGPSDDVSCADIGSFDFATDAHNATDAGVTGYHKFECRYSGVGTTDTTLTMVIGSSNYLINPAPSATHSQGTGDGRVITIQHLDANFQVIDDVDIKEVFIESVRVSATIEPTLNFAIAGLSSGTHCGEDIDVTTTAYSVPFGAISTANAFNDTAQQMTISTNADDGYYLYVYEDDELGLSGANSPLIPDTPCDTSCTHTTSDEWNTATNNGFGYSLENQSGTDATFLYSESSRFFSTKQFPNYTEGTTQHTDSSADIMSNAAPVSGSSIYVCYRLSVSGTQEAGQYWNTLTYIATPQF